MGYSIPDHIIQNVIDVTDIVDLISDFVSLKKRGKNYVGLCPFHQEKTPSFNVSPDKQIYHCFGCGKGGNSVSFLMEYDKMRFPEAIRFLAKRNGIDIPTVAVDEKEQSLTAKLYEANEFAAQYYENTLHQKAPETVRAYIRKRDLSDDSLKNFRLGYALPGWDNFLKVAGKRYTDDDLVQAGLVGKSQKHGTYFDYFRHRLMFPIHHHRGQVVAFGGRALDPEERAKYLNSPESPIFQKSQLLYGLYQAKPHLRQERFVILVEGYLDVIALHQAGIMQAVAPLGTALTTEQAHLMQRYADQVYIAFDSDEAGVKAAIRAIPILLQNDLSVHIVSLPAGDDPDTFVKTHGVAEFSQKLKDSPTFFDFMLNHYATRFNLQSVDGKSALAGEMATMIAAIKNPIQTALYRRQLAEFLNVSERTLATMIPTQSMKATSKGGTTSTRISSKLEKSERGVIWAFVEDAHYRAIIKSRIGQESFLTAKHRDVAADLWEADEMFGFNDENELWSIMENYLNCDETHLSILRDIYFSQSDQPFSEKVLKEWLNTMRLSELKNKKSELERELAEAKDDPNIVIKISEIKREMINIKQGEPI